VCEGELELTGAEGVQDAGLLLVGAEALDEEAGDEHGVQQRLGSQDAADLGEDGGEVFDARLEATELFGEHEALHVHLTQRVPDLFAEAQLGVGDGVACGDVLVVGRQQRADGFGKFVLFGHSGHSPRIAEAMIER